MYTRISFALHTRDLNCWPLHTDNSTLGARQPDRTRESESTTVATAPRLSPDGELWQGFWSRNRQYVWDLGGTTLAVGVTSLRSRCDTRSNSRSGRAAIEGARARNRGICKGSVSGASDGDSSHTGWAVIEVSVRGLDTDQS